MEHQVEPKIRLRPPFDEFLYALPIHLSAEEECHCLMEQQVTYLTEGLREQTKLMESTLRNLVLSSSRTNVMSVDSRLEDLSSAIQAMLDINRVFGDELTRALLLLQSTVSDFHREHAVALQRSLTRAKSEKATLQASLSEKTSACNRVEAKMQDLEISLREELQSCQICMVKPRNVVVMPCLHAHFCTDCLEEHRKWDTAKTKGCPTCRSPISGTVSYIA